MVQKVVHFWMKLRIIKVGKFGQKVRLQACFFDQNLMVQKVANFWINIRIIKFGQILAKK